MSSTGSVAPHVIGSGSYYYVHSGTKSLTFYGSGTCTAELPMFADPLNTLKITFYYANESSSYGTLSLGYFTTGDSVFHQIATYDNTTNHAFEMVSESLGGLPANAERLAFQWYCSSQWSCCVDDITISMVDPDCAGVNNFHVTDVTMTSATLEWGFSAGSNDAQIQVATDVNFTQLVDSAILANETSYILTGLQRGVKYYARARQLCRGGETSEWTRVISFSTAKYGIPFVANFTSTTMPTDWDESSNTAATVFSTGTMTTGSGSWSLIAADTVIASTHFRGNIFGTTWHNWVITPAIAMSSREGKGILLSFDAGLTPYSSSYEAKFLTGVDDRFLVAVSTDGGGTWSSANVTEWNNDGTGEYVYNEVPRHGKTYYIDMTSYIGNTVKIGFYGESSVANADNYFHFGNIRIEAVETTTYVDSICEGYSFHKNGFNVDYSDLQIGLNVFSRYDREPDGTMSITIQQVLVNASAENEIYVDLCEGEHYNGYGYDITATTSQTYRHRIRGGNVFGCDSTVYLHVNVLKPSYAELHVGCNEDSYTWNGRTFYQSTIAYDTTSSAVTGCDSITTLYLTFCNKSEYSYHAVFCQGGSYSDQFFENLTKPGEYRNTVTDEVGCVTNAHVILHQIPQGVGFVDTVLVKDLPYVLGNDTLCPVTDQDGFVYHGLKDFGCGFVNVTIYVVDHVALNNISAGKLEIAPNPVMVGEDIHILTDIVAASDYSCRVFDAVGKMVYETDEPSTVIPGLSVAGVYMVRIASGSTIYQGKLIVK